MQNEAIVERVLPIIRICFELFPVNGRWLSRRQGVSAPATKPVGIIHVVAALRAEQFRVLPDQGPFSLTAGVARKVAKMVDFVTVRRSTKSAQSVEDLSAETAVSHFGL